MTCLAFSSVGAINAPILNLPKLLSCTTASVVEPVTAICLGQPCIRLYHFSLIAAHSSRPVTQSPICRSDVPLRMAGLNSAISIRTESLTPIGAQPYSRILLWTCEPVPIFGNEPAAETAERPSTATSRRNRAIQIVVTQHMEADVAEE
jgi:hypothetical protein